MRLLNVHNHEFHEFPNRQNPPPYFIASHRWTDHEATFSGRESLANQRKFGSPGWLKVEGFCKFVQSARKDIDWIWIDSCCIDQTNNREVSYAIQVMYSWYARAEECVAYLADIPDGSRSTIGHSKKAEWYTRGWTLQELIAPKTVVFVSENFKTIGHKHHRDCVCVGYRGVNLNPEVSRATGVHTDILRGFNPSGKVNQKEVEERVKWTHGRETTQEEDIIYCLMGIFGVHMIPNYGEAVAYARGRLEDEMVRVHKLNKGAVERAIEGVGSSASKASHNRHDSKSTVETTARQGTAHPQERYRQGPTEESSRYEIRDGEVVQVFGSGRIMVRKDLIYDPSRGTTRATSLSSFQPPASYTSASGATLQVTWVRYDQSRRSYVDVTGTSVPWNIDFIPQVEGWVKADFIQWRLLDSRNQAVPMKPNLQQQHSYSYTPDVASTSVPQVPGPSYSVQPPSVPSARDQTHEDDNESEEDHDDDDDDDEGANSEEEEEEGGEDSEDDDDRPPARSPPAAPQKAYPHPAGNRGPVASPTSNRPSQAGQSVQHLDQSRSTPQTNPPTGSRQHTLAVRGKPPNSAKSTRQSAQPTSTRQHGAPANARR